MILAIDDIKTPELADVIARNPTAGAILLKTNKWEKLLIDFDLGEGEINGATLLDECYQNLPPIIEIISMNPVGRIEIETVLESLGYKKQGGLYVA